MNTLEEKISNFTRAIKDSLDSGNWYAALTLTLTLPDVCGRLEFPDKSSSKRTIHWFNEYLGENYMVKVGDFTRVFLSGEDFYALRCAYLHQGEVNIESQWIRKALEEFLFVEPPMNDIMHCVRSEGMLILQVDMFCLDVCNAVERWVKNVSSDIEVCKRAENLMTVRKIGKNFSF